MQWSIFASTQCLSLFTHPQQMTSVEELGPLVIVKVIPDKKKDVDGHPDKLETRRRSESDKKIHIYLFFFFIPHLRKKMNL